jgi:hypothetical protein
MTNVTMKATDTLHISSVGPENITPGQEFETTEGTAKELEARGLATRVKAEPAPENKADKPAPKGKAK